MKNYKLLELDKYKVVQICNKNAETIIKKHRPLKVRPLLTQSMAGSWGAGITLKNGIIKWHQTGQMSFPFSFLTNTSLLTALLYLCNGYHVTFLFLSSMFVGIVTIQIIWIMYSNVTQQCWINCNWQWLGFVCKVVLNEIPDNTHLIGIFTKHCTSSMAQIDYRCLATSNHITKTLDKNLTAISALSHLTLWATKYLDKQQVQWIYNQQKQIQTANTFP